MSDTWLTKALSKGEITAKLANCAFTVASLPISHFFIIYLSFLTIQ